MGHTVTELLETRRTSGPKAPREGRHGSGPLRLVCSFLISLLADVLPCNEECFGVGVHGTLSGSQVTSHTKRVDLSLSEDTFKTDTGIMGLKPV